MKTKRFNTVILIGAIAVLTAAAVLVAYLLGAFTGKSEKKDEIRIGVAVYRDDDTFISQIMAALNVCVQDWQRETGRRVYLNVAGAMDSQSTQNDQIERFISLGYDVLCVNLVDRTNASQIVDLASAAGIPVVFFNREPVTEDLLKWNLTCYVGSDARESAVTEAKVVIDFYDKYRERLDKNGDGVIQYIMLEGESGHQDAMIRTEYSVAALKNAGIELERIDGAIANWNRDQATALTEQYFQKYGDAIELIICNNDDMALGAADAARKQGVDFPYIVGIDGTTAGKAAVDEGRMLGTVDMNPSSHAEAIFSIALSLADTRSLPDTLGSDRSVRVAMTPYKSAVLFG